MIKCIQLSYETTNVRSDLDTGLVRLHRSIIAHTTGLLFPWNRCSPKEGQGAMQLGISVNVWGARIKLKITPDCLRDFSYWLWIQSSFFRIGWPAKVREPSLPYYFTSSRWRETWIHGFPKGISMKWNTYSFVKNLNLEHRVYFVGQYSYQSIDWLIDWF